MIKFLIKIIPISLKQFIRFVQLKFEIRLQEYRENKKIKEICKKDKITILFLIVNTSIWKYDALYQLFNNNSLFEPLIIICPFVTYGEEHQKKEMMDVQKFFSKKGYSTITTLDKNDDWLDIKKLYDPDIVFIPTPWNHTRSQYSFDNFRDILTCYIPYGFTISTNFKGHYNQNTQNLCWKFFVESAHHKKFAEIYSSRKGRNVFVSGYPKLDDFFDKDRLIKNNWKPQDKKKKKIIWAPHHTIEEVRSSKFYSTFMMYSELMLSIAIRYKDYVQFAFKPHPNLRGKLDEVWGIEKTNHYFKRWADLPNGQIEEGDYTDLFLTSDALIHDSASFLIEYLCTKKPMLFLMKSMDTFHQFNEFGKLALQKIPIGFSENEIIDFIEDTVINQKDNFKMKREEFLYSQIIFNKSPSENIYEHLLSQLKLD